MRTLAYQAVRQYKKWAARFLAESVRYEGLTMPAKHLRLCGAEFHEDRYFLDSARGEAQRLQKHFGLGKESRVLDVGCGMGRLAIGILSLVGEVREFHGLDVQENCVRWCGKHIGREHPAFRFTWVNAHNDRYNPAGDALTAAAKLPLPDASYDIIYLFSVFTHMVEADIRIYLKEFRRVLAPEGRIFFTAYVEDDVPDISVNPKGYLINCAGPLHIVRFNRSYFTSMLAEAGWKIDTLEHAADPSGQSYLYLTRN